MSALSKLEKLMYTIGVVDKATGPVNKIMSKFNQLSEQTRTAQDQIMRGFITAGSSGLALANSLSPAIDHVAALGEVQSLGVADEALTKLTKTSFDFSAQFGGNSAEFVRSAYDIQSAISGLEGVELSAFTKASNILAVATKADASTITSYMGTMYGIFEETANKMGKSDWVNKISGQTAKAVQMYKTTGSEMQAAFSALGAKATQRGANSAEQMAVLGELQLVLKSGSVAGTNYASFIDGIGKAEKALNISLTDKNGDMLGMDTMLGRINDKLKGIGSVAKGDILNQAFGSKTAASVVDILSTKVNKLTAGTDELNNVSDASKAIEMANIIASPWDRLSGTFNAAATAMGQRLLPVVEPFIEMLATAFNAVVNLTEQFPILSSVIATVVVGIVALITVFGLVTMSMGLYKYAMVTLSATTSILTSVTKVWTAAIWLSNKALAAGRMAATAYQQALLLSGIAMSQIKSAGFISTLTTIAGSLTAGSTAAWAFAAALLANPITWIVLGVVALVAALVGLVVYWDEVTKAVVTFFTSAITWFKDLSNTFNKWGETSLVFQALRIALDLITLPLQAIWKLSKIIATAFVDAFSWGVDAVNNFGNSASEIFNNIYNTVANFGTAISESFTNMWGEQIQVVKDFANYVMDALAPVMDLFNGIGDKLSIAKESVTGVFKDIADTGLMNMSFNVFGDDSPTAKLDTVTQAPNLTAQSNVVSFNEHQLVRNRDLTNQTRNNELHSKTYTNATQSLVNNQLAGNSIALDKNSQVYNATLNNKAQTSVIGFNNNNLVSKSDLTTQKLVSNKVNSISSNNAISQNKTDLATLQLTNNKVNSMSTNNAIAHNKTELATQQLVSNKVNSISSNSAISDNKVGFATQQLVSNKVNSISSQNTSPVNKINPVFTYSNASLNNVYALNQRSENIEQYQKDNENLVANSSRKIEKSAFLQQLTSNSSNNETNNNTDNSKRVFIDNLTLQSNDVANSFEQLMEVAG